MVDLSREHVLANSVPTHSDPSILTTQSFADDGEYVVTFEGRSQYGIDGGGASACGLAALNCARVVLGRERDGIRGGLLIDDMTKKETLEEILRICLQWTTTAHLDVEEIFEAPIFDQTLRKIWSVYERPSLEQFHDLLRRLQETNGSVSVVITRPPEIISVVKIVVEDKDVFVIFDSHPRAKHPGGAGFIFNTSILATARHLNDLFQYDPGLLADRSMQWQVQLLTNYSAHCFASKKSLAEPSDLMEAVINSSLEVLILRAELADLKRQNRKLQDDKERLSEENERLEGEVDDLEIAIRQERQIARAASFVPPPIPGSWDSDQWDYPKAGPSTLSFKSNGRSNVQDTQTPVPTSKALAADVKASPAPAPPSRALPSKIITTSSNRKLVVHTSEELDENDIVFAQMQFEWQEESDARESAKMAAEVQRQFEIENADYDESARLAAEIQREFQEEDTRLRRQLLKLQEETDPTFNCGICLDEHSEQMVARVIPCDHAFCRDSLREYIRSKLGDHRFPILCPVCAADGNAADPSTITTNMAQQIGISEEEHTIFTELELAAFSVPLRCRRCQGTAFVDREEYDETRVVVCPLPNCTFAWCKTCSQPIEFNGIQHSCDGSSELNHLMSQKGWKHCPGCKTPAEKIDGCNHMTCPSPGCNTHFCYACGAIIVKSVTRQEIQRALSAHYNRCRLLDDTIGARVFGRRR